MIWPFTKKIKNEIHESAQNESRYSKQFLKENNAGYVVQTPTLTVPEVREWKKSELEKYKQSHNGALPPLNTPDDFNF